MNYDENQLCSLAIMKQCVLFSIVHLKGGNKVDILEINDFQQPNNTNVIFLKHLKIQYLIIF